jgi:probable F420-dependent oxidoreductase
MKIGLFAPLVTPQADRAYLVTLAERADALGFSSLWFGEHVLTFDENRSPYPYSSDGRMPRVDPEAGLPELFTTLAFLAARTERIELGTGVCLLPIRHPALTAKEAINLDWLTNQRFNFGVGLGWSEDEYESMGAGWSDRGRRMDDHLRLISTLWREPVTTYSSKYSAVTAARMNPKPAERTGVHGGRIPIYIGGASAAALRRVAEFGHGWYAFALTPEQIAEHLRTLAPLLEKQGRAPGDLDVVVCPYHLPIDRTLIEQYQEAGVDQVLVTVIANDVDQLERRLDRAAALMAR